MALDTLPDGQRACVCGRCGAVGPTDPKAGPARAAAKAAGWARSYPRGYGEAFFCPDCRCHHGGARRERQTDTGRSGVRDGANTEPRSAA